MEIAFDCECGIIESGINQKFECYCVYKLIWKHAIL